MNMKWRIPKECNGCTACVNICPRKCITMKRSEEGFLYPTIEESKCIQCGLCQKVCSISAQQTQSEIIGAYAAINSDLNTRLISSSGGVFALLAKRIILEGGVVFGAVLSEDCKSVKHSSAHNLEELQRMYGSKYLQSDMGNTYSQVKRTLDEGKMVLFSGTPCQINGLYMFLGHKYENLILVDVICHGVPSPVLWDKYVSHIEKKYRSFVQSVNFRCKNYGWEEFGIKRVDKKNRELFISKSEDSFLQFFLRNYSLRQSCYQCCAKEMRWSDLTLGDFWGIENVFPEMNDGNGASAVIIRTEKGRSLFQQVASGMNIKETEYHTIVEYNSAENTSVYKPKQRDTFFEDMNTMSYQALGRKYLPKTVKQRMRAAITRIGICKKKGGGYKGVI